MVSLKNRNKFTSHEYLFYADFQSINTFPFYECKNIFLWIRCILFKNIVYNGINRRTVSKANLLSTLQSLYDFLFNICDHWECLHSFLIRFVSVLWKTGFESTTKNIRQNYLDVRHIYFFCLFWSLFIFMFIFEDNLS